VTYLDMLFLSNLNRKCVSFLDPACAHHAIFTAKLCFNRWGNVSWISGSDSDCPFGIEMIEQSSNHIIESIESFLCRAT